MKKNNILELKGSWLSRENKAGFSPLNLPKNKFVTLDHINNLISDLEILKTYWLNNKLGIDAIISVYYIDMLAKSNRINSLLVLSSEKADELIVGSKYMQKEGEEKKHVITYSVDVSNIEKTISLLKEVYAIIEKYFDNYRITHNDILEIHSGKNKITYKNGNFTYINNLSRNKFLSSVIDCYFVESFGTEKISKNFDSISLVTIYKTKIASEVLLKKLGLDINIEEKIDDNSFLLTREQINVIKEKAPFLISMAVQDINEIPTNNSHSIYEKIKYKITEPDIQPTIGVIDTMFDIDVPFKNWVEFDNRLNPNIEIKEEDKQHGTWVSSIIVDGPQLNPELEDNCGKFKVKHFGVSLAKNASSAFVTRKIKEVVNENPNIHVWNLCLGSSYEVNPNFVSYEAAVLDELQHQNNVIFIVSGTNKIEGTKSERIGLPADSVNSIVVNSVDFLGRPTSYSRKGPVLSFFQKPDVSYYGGTMLEPIKVYGSKGVEEVYGTSFAAPWIARKVAYLIEILGRTREEAKALIIHNASGWEEKSEEEKKIIGYGIVSKDINDLISSPKDEIKIIISGQTKKYETYNFSLPVPQNHLGFPYIAKATMAYFPKCSRSQGVDYTNTELDLYFGRLGNDNKIKAINNNVQTIPSDTFENNTKESKARNKYRKWDNVKHIFEIFKKNSRPRKVYNYPFWGINVVSKKRLKKDETKNINFSIAITLKAMDEVNRYQDFITNCIIQRWTVEEIDHDGIKNIYRKSNEELEWKKER